MATTAMNTYSYEILVESGGHPTVTMITNDTSIFPGTPVTCTGQSWPDVGQPDAIGDSIFGVAGLRPDQDIGTAYANNVSIPIHRTGCGDVVMMYHKGTPSGGSIVAGDILVSCGLEDAGHVAPLAKQIDAITAADYTSTVLATTITILYSIVGRAQETHASAANNTPIKVLLSV
jgi:hypothetical protein